MAKLLVFAAALVAILAGAQAARFTVTTTVDEVDNQMGGRCQQQIQQQYPRLRQCQQYLQSRRWSPFEMDMMIQESVQQEPQQQHLRQCCQALENIDDERCRCDAVRMAVRQVESQGQAGYQGEQLRQRARFLPQQCNLGPQQCRV